MNYPPHDNDNVKYQENICYIRKNVYFCIIEVETMWV